MYLLAVSMTSGLYVFEQTHYRESLGNLSHLGALEFVSGFGHGIRVHGSSESKGLLGAVFAGCSVCLLPV